MISLSGACHLLVTFLLVSFVASLNETNTVTDETETEKPSGPVLTGDPQKDYIHDPNLPIELHGYDLSDYPFYKRVPKEGHNFTCDGRLDGFYAAIPHKCQVYYNCLFGQRYDFLCANYTVFDQANFICHYASEVNCDISERYYVRNEELYVTTTTTTQAPQIIYVERPRARPRPIRPLNNKKTRLPPRRRFRPGPKRRTTTPAPAQDYYDYYDQNYDEDYYDYPEETVATTTTTTTTTSTTQRPRRRTPGTRGGDAVEDNRRDRPRRPGGRRPGAGGGRRRTRTTTTTQAPAQDYYDDYYYDYPEEEAKTNKSNSVAAKNSKKNNNRREDAYYDYDESPVSAPIIEQPQTSEQRRTKPGQRRRPSFKRSQSSGNTANEPPEILPEKEESEPLAAIDTERPFRRNGRPRSPIRNQEPLTQKIITKPIDSEGNIVDDIALVESTLTDSPKTQEEEPPRADNRRRRPSFRRPTEPDVEPQEQVDDGPRVRPGFRNRQQT